MSKALVLVLASAVALEAQVDCRSMSDKTIRWIVPNAPGGGYDTYSRLLEPFFEKELGAEIVVENLSGAGGIIAARTLARAAPDGLTLGILNGPGLLVTALAGETEVPRPAEDFTILARVARSQHVWAAGSDSPLHSIEAVLRAGETRRLVFGVREVGGVAFVSIALTTALLDLDVSIVAGFGGSRDAALAVMRGDVDLVVYSYDSIRDAIRSGDLVPILQVSDAALSRDPELAGVPVLGGKNGVAAQRATARGMTVEEAIANASAVSAVIGAGRLIAAPRGLPEDVFACLEEKLHRVLTSPEFRAAAAQAGQSLDAARSAAATREVQWTADRVQQFLPIVQEAVRQSRR
jgi:tripartite-type tricarboxylate transporter receptor subunit TctC